MGKIEDTLAYLADEHNLHLVRIRPIAERVPMLGEPIGAGLSSGLDGGWAFVEQGTDGAIRAPRASVEGADIADAAILHLERIHNQATVLEQSAQGGLDKARAQLTDSANYLLWIVEDEEGHPELRPEPRDPGRISP